MDKPYYIVDGVNVFPAKDWQKHAYLYSTGMDRTLPRDTEITPNTIIKYNQPDDLKVELGVFTGADGHGHDKVVRGWKKEIQDWGEWYYFIELPKKYNSDVLQGAVIKGIDELTEDARRAGGASGGGGMGGGGKKSNRRKKRKKSRRRRNKSRSKK